ncbi:hypothetical protein [Pseudonocardia sp.]|nr:hypothetical protein [Pseudonocardia sp.]MCW2720941.1 hypothetical protein [Pseudonocardia sp.]MDT7613320.1 hypothetical protein [Pseudonocardiales bacterium]
MADLDGFATRVGYRDPAYFTRRFRTSNRTTPGEWRRAGRDSQAAS